ncbi:PBSX family phage portal protein [Yersinia aldovae]|uniref:hypothetical protein n=1 Tax=Yersinia aldovae TaxID=29483 RepID=UPI0005DFB9B8|nr:hypothetical protein [Yersinia aldovae]CNK20266.1 PBSX family phage portal protein [Yersinia aldovae]
MSKFVKIKSGDSHLIVNTDNIESIMEDGEYRKIYKLNGGCIRTMATFDDITAAIIPVEVKQFVAIDTDSKPVALRSEGAIFRPRYYHNDAHAGFILFANEPDFSDEMKADIDRKIEELGGKVEFKNIFINTPPSDDESQGPAEPIADGQSLTVEIAPGYFLTRTPGKVHTSTPGVSFSVIRNIISAAISEAAFQAEPAQSGPQSHLPEPEAPQ